MSENAPAFRPSWHPPARTGTAQTSDGWRPGRRDGQREGRRGALSVQLVLLSILLVIVTVTVVTVTVVRMIDPQTEQASGRDVATILLPVLLGTLPLLCAGALLGYLLAARVRTSAAQLAGAAARLRRGDLDGPMPEVPESELVPLADELAQIRTHFQDQIRQQLRAAGIEEQRERALLATLREPVITASTRGLVTAFNAAAVAMFGKVDDFYGRSIQEVLPFVTPPAEAERLDGSSTGPATTWQGSIAVADGQTLHLEVSRTLLGEGRRVATDVYVVHDISRYAELDHLREQLLANVAYELRAPLAILDNALDMLDAYGEALDAAALAKLVSSAKGSARRLRRLMDNLLCARAIQAGQLAIHAQPVDVASLIDEAVTAMGEGLSKGTRPVERHLPARPLFVSADPRLLCQAVSSILIAAARCSPEGMPVRVQAEQVGSYVRLLVEDSGPGMPPEQEAELLGRFYRSRGAGEEPGINLGLAIARGVIEAHAGRIGVERPDGAGTCVWLTLPAAPSSL